MDRKLKERLLGAVVIVVFAVLVVPALLDGPPPSDASVTRELEVPAADAPDTRRHTIDLSAPADRLPVPARSAPAATVGAAAAEEAGAGAPPAEPDDRGGDAAGDSLAAPAAPAVPPAAPPPTEDVTRPAVAATAAPKTAEPKTATPMPAPPPGDGWAVQVGSFSTEGNALRLAELLERKGYPAYVARNVVGGRVMYRVRIGPAAEKPRAEQWLAELREAGRPAQLVSQP